MPISDPPPPDSVAPRWAWFAASGLLLAAALGSAWLARAPADEVRPYVAAPAAPPPAADLVERSATLADPSGLAALLRNQGAAPADADAAAALALPHLASGGEVEVAAALRPVAGGALLQQVRVTRADSSGVRVARTAGGWRAEPLERAVETRILVGRGEMNADSLYASAVAAGIDEGLIPDFAKAFAFDFDFQREIDPGDVFEMAAEQEVGAGGEAVGPPRLVYAAFTTAAKARALYFFRPSAGEAGWFDGNGRSVVRALMRTPVDGARVTSRFGSRVHPVLGYTKMHNGIDFGAPTGTPVYAAGAGEVVAAAPRGAAGNAVILRHEEGLATFYFHLSAFAPGLAAGAPVRQGQLVGLVGTTGRSTGPHLHYGVQIGGAWTDPTSIAVDEGRALGGADLDAFRRERDRIDTARAAHRG